MCVSSVSDTKKINNTFIYLISTHIFLLIVNLSIVVYCVFDIFLLLFLDWCIYNYPARAARAGLSDRVWFPYIYISESTVVLSM